MEVSDSGGCGSACVSVSASSAQCVLARGQVAALPWRVQQDGAGRITARGVRTVGCT